MVVVEEGTCVSFFYIVVSENNQNRTSYAMNGKLF